MNRELVHAVTSHTKFKIAKMLTDKGEIAPSYAVERLEIHQSTVSLHLKQLLDVGAVEKQKRDQKGKSREDSYVTYSPTDELHEVMEFIES